MKTRFLITPILAAVLLAGCTPPEATYFGVPQSQWVHLSKSQQKQVIKSYNHQQQVQAQADAKRQEIEAQNAPIQALISATQDVMNNKNNQH